MVLKPKKAEGCEKKVLSKSRVNAVDTLGPKIPLIYSTSNQSSSYHIKELWISTNLITAMKSSMQLLKKRSRLGQLSCRLVSIQSLHSFAVSVPQKLTVDIVQEENQCHILGVA